MIVEALLYLTAPIVGIIYSILEHHGVWDKLTGRNKAMDGLRRLRSGGGYPESFIYNRDSDSKEFNALLKRIRKIAKKNANTELPTKAGEPVLISTAGKPIPIEGLPPDWPQKSRFFYSDNYPVLLVFGALKEDGGMEGGKAFKACTLKDIDDWIKNEKENRKIYVGTLMIGIIAIALIIIRLMIHKGT